MHSGAVPAAGIHPAQEGSDDEHVGGKPTAGGGFSGEAGVQSFT